MKKLIGLAFLAVALAACNDGASTTENASNPSHPIVGTWTWVRTESGESVKIPWTPATAGYTQTYKFNSDSTFSFTRTPDSTNASHNGDYRLSRRFDTIEQDTESFVTFDWIPSLPPKILVWTLIQFHGLDTMSLGEGATDGPVEFYVRMR